jgi:hypothetical protein
MGIKLKLRSLFFLKNVRRAAKFESGEVRVQVYAPWMARRSLHGRIHGVLHTDFATFKRPRKMGHFLIKNHL